jgi:hypothetical protein
MTSAHYRIFSVIAVKLNECYSVSYLYASNATNDKDADPLSGEPVNVPRP